jgi:hypothetical protein
VSAHLKAMIEAGLIVEFRIIDALGRTVYWSYSRERAQREIAHLRELAPKRALSLRRYEFRPIDGWWPRPYDALNARTGAEVAA